MSAATVTREVKVHVVLPAGGPDRVPVVLSYDASDPYAVSLQIHATPGEPVSWVFARELLDRGLARPAGNGDVRIWPSRPDAGEQVRVAMSSPDGQAQVAVSAASLADFLDESYRVCPPGRESENLDLDRELRSLTA
jgi:hypothetical protein